MEELIDCGTVFPVLTCRGPALASRGTMQIRRWLLVGFSLHCMLGAGACMSPVTGPDAGTGASEAADDGEENGEAAEEVDFSASNFRFSTLVKDDGTGKAGGWQAASAVLKFGDWRGLVPNFWQCPLTVGVPIRAEVAGHISPEYAAQITAAVASDASSEVMHSRPAWVGAAYCLEFYEKMRQMFRVRYSVPATVSRS
jgi:hypothetical protein